MTHRTWIIETLRLHFEDKLSRVEAGRRLGIPKTTACDLFVRFIHTGLTWPLTDNISNDDLNQRLYQRAPPSPDSTVVAPAPAVHLPGRKRSRRANFPRAFKIDLVRQSMHPGISVAQLARENGINDNLLFNWRRQYLRGLLTAGESAPVLLPVALKTEVSEPAPALSAEEPCCELLLPAGTLRIRGALTPALLQMLILEMRGNHR